MTVDNTFNSLLILQQKALASGLNGLQKELADVIGELETVANLNTPFQTADIVGLKERVLVQKDTESLKKLSNLFLPLCSDEVISRHLGLDTWETSGNKEDACSEIISCFRERDTSLTLKFLGLTSLPSSVWEYLSHLCTIDCSCNYLEALPSEIGMCSQLETLNCTSNQLSALPKEIGQCTQLKELLCSINRIKEIPNEIGNCAQLIQLDCKDNRLTALPPEIGKCTQLKLLKCSMNTIAVLPPEIGTCAHLQFLLCSNNALIILPEEIGNCTSLKHLFCENNDLSELPDTLIQCAQLTHLNCRNNRQLTELPPALRRPTLRIDTDISLPFSWLDPFKESVTVPALRRLNTHPLEDSALSVALGTWVQKLKRAEDYKNVKTRSQFCERVLEVVQFAIQNAEYLNTFFKPLLEDAGTTCADRATLTLNILELQKNILQNPDPSLKGVLKVLRGAFSMVLLKECAKIKTAILIAEYKKAHPDVQDKNIPIDEIEIELGYQSKLREKLSLPLKEQTMNYFSYSGLTDKDLDEAEQKVKEALANHALFTGYLIHQETWTKRLLEDFAQEKESVVASPRRRMDVLEEKAEHIELKAYLGQIDQLDAEFKRAEKEWLRKKTLEILSDESAPAITSPFQKI